MGLGSLFSQDKTQSTATQNNNQVAADQVSGVQFGAFNNKGASVKTSSASAASAAKAQKQLNAANAKLAKLQSAKNPNQNAIQKQQTKVASAQGKLSSASSASSAGSGNVNIQITQGDIQAVQQNSALALESVQSAESAALDYGNNVTQAALGVAAHVADTQALLAQSVVQAGQNFAALAVPNTLTAQSIAEPTIGAAGPLGGIPMPSRKALWVIGLVGAGLTLAALLKK